MSVSHHSSEAFILTPRVSYLVCVRESMWVCCYFSPRASRLRAAAGAGWEELACIVAISIRSLVWWLAERERSG